MIIDRKEEKLLNEKRKKEEAHLRLRYIEEENLYLREMLNNLLMIKLKVQ